LSVKLEYPTLKLSKKPKEPLWNIDIAASAKVRAFKLCKITKNGKEGFLYKVLLNKVF